MPVLLADDHALVRAGLRTLIEKIASASPWLALLMLALVWPGAVGQSAVEMPRTIRVVMDNAYAPYSFQSGDRKLQGILVDQWQAWEKKTGIKVEMHALDWGEALRRMRAGEFDVIDSIVMTPERRDYFDFTPAYTPIEASIFFRNDISGITDIASLKGFPVGVKAGDQHIDKLKENGVTTVIPFQNNDEIIEAARQRKINVFVVDDPSALYLLNKMGIGSEFRHSAPIFRDELRRAVRKGDAALLRTVSEGFAAIEPGELKQIDEKWFGRTVSRIGHYLTYAGYAAALALLLIAGLSGWNRALRKKILQRTAALSESEQRFRRLVELMPVAVYMCDTSGIIQIYNHRAVELWGREPKSGDTAQRYCASLRLWSPDGKLVPHEESKMAEVLRTGVPAHDLEVVIERPDGSRITTLVNIAPLRNSDGELIGALNCFQDITERKQAQDRLRRSEEKFKTLFGIAPVGISVLDRQHNIVDANPALEQITRLSKEELLNGTYRRRTYLNADGTPKPANEMASERAITENRPLNDVETGIVTENGEIIWTQVSVAPLALPDASAVVITQDITEHKRAAKELEEANHRLRILSRRLFEVQEEERHHLARELHDEIGQALTAAKINLQSITGNGDSANFARLQETTAILDRLLGQVRQISLDLHPSLLDDLGLAPALRSLLDQQARRAGLRAQFSAVEPLANIKRGIQTTGFRIAQEAITNILRHANAGFVSVHLRTETGELRMKIVDDGRGFDLAEIEGRTCPDRGFGLMGMRERAASVGGRVQIVSSPRTGTTVEVSLPLNGSGQGQSG